MKKSLPQSAQPEGSRQFKTAWETLPIRSARTQNYWPGNWVLALANNAPAAFSALLPTLQSELERELSETLSQSLEENNQTLNAYLSNCRYGLANTYDKNPKLSPWPLCLGLSLLSGCAGNSHKPTIADVDFSRAPPKTEQQSAAEQTRSQIVQSYYQYIEKSP